MANLRSRREQRDRKMLLDRNSSDRHRIICATQRLRARSWRSRLTNGDTVFELLSLEHVDEDVVENVLRPSCYTNIRNLTLQRARETHCQGGWLS